MIVKGFAICTNLALSEYVHICISNPLAYLKYSNKHVLTANVSAYVKFVNTFVCQKYLRKIVVLPARL
jgi:hypothetical protein